ncbi:MAG: hypothetical protein U0795_25085 [Pirellulales bacterium]
MKGLWAGIVCLLAGLSAAGSSEAASYRTRNFIVTAANNQLAHQVGDTAEQYRKQLAIEWVGRELPPWRQPCPIEVTVGPNMPASGVTQFTFRGDEPGDWIMQINGTPERVLDSVLPHEITHTIFATYFRRPLPRWADEGACTTVEHPSEKSKQDKLLVRFLSTNRGIAFRDMFAMTEYPQDVLPLYSQGYSLTRFLISQGGRRQFIRFLGEGMETERWSEAIRRNYGFENLSALQLAWVDWVRVGSPPLAPDHRPDMPIVKHTPDPAKSPVAPNSWYLAVREGVARPDTDAPPSISVKPSPTTDPAVKPLAGMTPLSGQAASGAAPQGLSLPNFVAPSSLPPSSLAAPSSVVPANGLASSANVPGMEPRLAQQALPPPPASSTVPASVSSPSSGAGTEDSAVVLYEWRAGDATAMRR